MSNNLVQVLLIGAGAMSQDYAKVLMHQNVGFTVIGRGNISAQRFHTETGIDVIQGGVQSYLEGNPTIPPAAIIAVGVEQLEATTILLLKAGIKRILVEKPAGINNKEIFRIAQEARSNNAEVFVAYNRRFYAATNKAIEIIRADGGVISFLFEFTEWNHVIETLNIDPRVKNNWFLANSSHVVDLAFFLCGDPIEISAFFTGSLSWHPSASVFTGAGKTKNGALFSYHANWAAPGRWGLEILTAKHRLIFRPIEQLLIQELGSITAEPVDLDGELDLKFKPGLYRQVHRFFSNSNSEGLISVEEHLFRSESVFAKICPQY